jgi:hypothetical protein
MCRKCAFKKIQSCRHDDACTSFLDIFNIHIHLLKMNNYKNNQQTRGNLIKTYARHSEILIPFQFEILFEIFLAKHTMASKYGYLNFSR